MGKLSHGGGKPNVKSMPCKPPVGPKGQSHVGPGMGPGGKNVGNSGTQRKG